MPACQRCGAELVPPYVFCGQCGHPAGAPGVYPPYPYYPPPRKDHTLTIIVIVVVLVIAIPMILAAALYVMVSGLIGGPSAPQKPMVTFSSVTKLSAVTWSFTVAGATSALAPSNYKLNFGIGSVIGSASSVGVSGENVTISLVGATPSSVGITWTDIAGTATVKAGDVFTVAFASAPATGTLLTFYLLYADGSQIQTMSWQG